MSYYHVYASRDNDGQGPETRIHRLEVLSTRELAEAFMAKFSRQNARLNPAFSVVYGKRVKLEVSHTYTLALLSDGTPAF